VVVGDVGDRALVRAVMEAHDVIGVVHTAGSTVVPESVRRPLGCDGWFRQGGGDSVGV
jgi:UDP-glucose 4-epimerase